MKISIFGTGYVGLVSGSCLAEVGHEVVCVDIDPEKIQNLKAGLIHIWEPGLAELVKRNVKEGRLKFTDSAEEAVKHSKVHFIAVGTPPDENGNADLQFVLQVARTIAKYMAEDNLIINKSTVPVGTSEKVTEAIRLILCKQKTEKSIKYEVISNPEFLKEGAAVSDFMKPDRIIIGATSARAKLIMKEIYEPFNRNNDHNIFMDVRSAELTKYAANAMLATKISFMNEIGNIAELLGADIEEVRKGIGSDPRIGYQFIYPGCGYGGSCFPKDVEALVQTAVQTGYDAQLLKAVEHVNNRQKVILFKKLIHHFGGASQLKGKTFAVWGLSFKPNTDDMREAPSRFLMEDLWKAGAKVQAYDPVAMGEAKRIYSKQSSLSLHEDKYSALEGADALIICTEWQQFRIPDFKEMASKLRNKVIVDGRNIYQPEKMREKGWVYLPIGRNQK
jgi:UDPglucose 6-dehydrogenase